MPVLLYHATQLCHFVIDYSQGFRVAVIVCLNVRLHQERIVHSQLLVESNCCLWWEHSPVCLVKLGADVVGYKTSKAWHDYTIVLEQKYLYMSVDIEHSCAKLNDFPEYHKQIIVDYSKKHILTFAPLMLSKKTLYLHV